MSSRLWFLPLTPALPPLIVAGALPLPTAQPESLKTAELVCPSAQSWDSPLKDPPDINYRPPIFCHHAQPWAWIAA